jgi:hypothetical protein
MQEFHRVVPLDLSVWTMDCVSEAALFLELPVPTKHGHLQSVHNIVLMVCVNIPATDDCSDSMLLVNESSAIGLTACDVNSRTFGCGLNGNQCQNAHSTFTMAGGNALVLRPAQIQALVSNYSTSAHESSHQYGVGSMVGLALGVGLPLAFSLLMALLVLRKERQRFAHQHMFEQRMEPMDPPGNYRRRSFSTLSKSGTMTTIASTSTYAPQQPKASLQKYGYQRHYTPERDLSVPVFELPSNPPQRHERVEAP